jgi:hypothetical protein
VAQNEIVQSPPEQVSPVQEETVQSSPDQDSPIQGEPPVRQAVVSALPVSKLTASQPPQPLYQLGDVLWVPGMMAPAMAFIFLIVIRMRFS